MKPRPCARACKRRCRYSRLMNPRSPARCAFAIRASSLVTSVSARCNAALCSTRLIRNAAAAAATVYAPCSGSSASPNCLWPSSTVGLQRQSRKRIATGCEMMNHTSNLLAVGTTDKGGKRARNIAKASRRDRFRPALGQDLANRRHLLAYRALPSRRGHGATAAGGLSRIATPARGGIRGGINRHTSGPSGNPRWHS